MEKNLLKNFSKQQPHFFNLILVSLFLVWIIFSISYGERILAGNGLGYDGVKYTAYAKNFYEFILNHKISEYSSQRLFVPFLINLASKLFHFTITKQNAPFLFSLLNASMLTFCLVLWVKLAKKMSWSPSVKLISFSGLFLNFAILKMSFFYPTLTDTTAFALGFYMLYLYVNGSNKMLLLTSFIGAFTFPTLLYEGLLLFMFPSNLKNKIGTSNKNKLRIFLLIVSSVIITILCISICYNHDYIGGGRAIGGNYSLPVLCISSIALFLYLTLCFNPISKYFSGILQYFQSFLIFRKILVALVIILTVRLLIKLISAPDVISPLNFWSYIIHIAGQSLAYPFNFIISHVIYFGPIVCLLVLFWKDVIAYLIEQGSMGLLFLLGIYSLLALGSESRQLINFLPVAVFIISEIINRKAFSQYFAMIFTFISLLVSKFWFPINHGKDWPSLLTQPLETILQFPLQWYFMNFGPWVSHTMFVVNFIISAIAFFSILILVKREISKRQNLTGLQRTAPN